MDFFSRKKQTRQSRTRIKPTRYGWVGAFLLFWIPLTAVFTANNFLMIVFIMMIGMAVVSHRLAKGNIDSVRIMRRFPNDLYAGTPFSIRYRLETDQMLWGALTLWFEEGTPLEGDGQGVFFSRIPARKNAVEQGYYTLPKRGDHRIPEGMLKSSFPFGLATYWRRCGGEESVLVFPHIQSVEEDIPINLGGFGRGREKADPFGTVPYLFRDYVPGDPYKQIDWKKTARSGNLVTKVLSEEGAREITLQLPANASERAVSRAASLVVHFGRQGIPVSLRGPGFQIEAGRGKEFSRKLLSILARWPQSPEMASGQDQSSGLVVEIDDSGDFLWKQSGN